jgi:DNA-binding SARP family transcriptional activator
MRLELLGPVRIWGWDRMVVLGPPKQRAVIGLLASRVNEVVGVDEIVDSVWGSAVPQTAVNGVHTYVAGLRRVLEPDREARESGGIIVSAGGGYLLNLKQEAVDVHQFVRRHRQAKHLHDTGRPAEAAQLYESAMSLWHGDAYANVPGPFAEMERTRLQELRLTAIEEWAAATLAMGRPTETVSILSGLVLREPLRERLRWLLMLALYRCGRRAHALGLYRQTRLLLKEELGIEPGPELRKLHEHILAGHPALFQRVPAAAPVLAGAAAVGSGTNGSAAASDVAASGPAGQALQPVESPQARRPRNDVPRPAQLPPSARGFMGRTAELSRLRGVAVQDRTPQVPSTLVIEGEAGVGKSALALHLAHQLSDRYPDGQLFVDLQGANPEKGSLSAWKALAQLLRSLGVDDSAMPADLEGRTTLYRSLLYGKQVLLVLDDALDAEQVRPLIPRGPVCVVVTSRHCQSDLAARDGAFRVELGPLAPGDTGDLLAYLIGADRVAGHQDALMRLGQLCGHLPLALRIAAAALTAEPHLPLAEFVEEQAVRLGQIRGRMLRGNLADELCAGVAA